MALLDLFLGPARRKPRALGDPRHLASLELDSAANCRSVWALVDALADRMSACIRT